MVNKLLKVFVIENWKCLNEYKWVELFFKILLNYLNEIFDEKWLFDFKWWLI